MQNVLSHFKSQASRKMAPKQQKKKKKERKKERKRGRKKVLQEGYFMASPQNEITVS